MEDFSPPLALILSALAALFGGMLGTYLGLYQKSRESALERKLSWYEAMFKGLMSGRARILDEIRAVERGEGDLERLADTITDALRDVRDLRLTAALYASESLLRQLDTIFDESQQVLDKAVAKAPLPEPQFLALAKRLSNFDLRAAKTIASEVRRELRIKSLRRYWQSTGTAMVRGQQSDSKVSAHDKR